MVVLNFLCVQHSFLSCKLAANFSAFSVFILSGERVNHSEGHVIFQDIEHPIQENILHDYLHYIFCEIFIKLRCFFNPLKTV